MIKNKIDKYMQCSEIDKALYPAFKWLKNLDVNYKNGLYILNGSEVFANIQNYNTKTSDSVYTEFHKKYIDIQYMISGKETIYLNGTAPKINEFDTANDIGFIGVDDVSPVQLTAGEFVIIFPGELHKPCCISESSCFVKKAVVKIDIRALNLKW